MSLLYCNNPSEKGFTMHNMYFHWSCVTSCSICYDYFKFGIYLCGITGNMLAEFQNEIIYANKYTFGFTGVVGFPSQTAHKLLNWSTWSGSNNGLQSLPTFWKCFLIMFVGNVLDPWNPQYCLKSSELRNVGVEGYCSKHWNISNL